MMHMPIMLQHDDDDDDDATSAFTSSFLLAVGP